jgi:glutamate N-acetyltransferase/amino-acid N-acetyltransferase
MTSSNGGETRATTAFHGVAAASPTAAADLSSPAVRAGVVALEEAPRLPRGFAAGGVSAGIKASGRPDVAIVTVTGSRLASAAAMFTQNLVAAAPVRLSRAHLEASGGRVRGVIISSGCANAATGPEGDADHAAVAAELAAALGCRPEETLLAATGLIGMRLPVDRVRDGIAALLPGHGVHTATPDGVSADDRGLGRAVDAMMTTDTRRKAATVTLRLPEPDAATRAATREATREVRVTGIAKGVGMIHPSMATMIAVLLTDAAVEPPVLQRLLGPAVATSFDLLSVDGDTSTNDTVFALASGASGAAEVTEGTEAAVALGAAIAAVCRSLARQQAADGEGATTLITCRATGAADVADARAVARAVISSNLVKAAVCGRDPNWGRAASAAGAARRPDGTPVGLRPETLSISVCGSPVFAGRPLPFDAAAVSAAMHAPEVVFELDLGKGTASAEAWGCDLTEAYVRENSEYST